jgi:MFS family permease
LGLVLGGVLTETLNWRWIFTINIPFGVLILATVPFFMAETRGAERTGGVDLPGTVLVVAAGLVGIDAIVQAADVGWLTARTLGLGAVAVVLLAAFVGWEARTAYPLMPLRILRLRSLMGSSAIRAVIVVSMYGNFFFGTLFLAQVLGYSPIRTGLAYLPQTICVAVLSLGLTARLMRRFGPRSVLLVGLVIVLAGLLLLLKMNAGTGYVPLIFGSLLLIGVGVGLVFMPLLTMAVADVVPADAGLASGIVNVSSQISAAVGLAVLGSVASSRTDTLLAHGHSATDALIGGNRLGLLIAAGCVVVGFLLALLVLRAPAPTPAPALVVEPEPDLNPAA